MAGCVSRKMHKNLAKKRKENVIRLCTKGVLTNPKVLNWSAAYMIKRQLSHVKDGYSISLYIFNIQQ